MCFMAGSPDGVTMLASLGAQDPEPIMLEVLVFRFFNFALMPGMKKLLRLQVKCPYRRRIVPGTVPHHYYAQVQLNMLICGLSHSDFVEFKPPPDFILSIVRVYPDRAWLAESVPKLRAFHKLMVLYAGDKIVDHPKYAKYASRYGPDAKPRAPRLLGAAAATAATTLPLDTPWLGDSFF
jgi:hypothetical protein